MKSERFRNLVKAHRDGICLQAFAAPSLFAPGTGVMAPTAPGFVTAAEKMTTVNVAGRMTKGDLKKFAVSAVPAMVEGKLALARSAAMQDDEAAAAATVSAIVG
jgi:hypothetical protein